MARKNTPLQEELKELFQKNGRLLTIFATIMILVVGFTIVDDPGRWWISLIAIFAFFIVAFLFSNARVLIKSTLATLLVLFESAFAFKVGSFSSLPGDGVTWMSCILMGFFTSLAISYLFPSPKGRWGIAAVSVSIGYILTYSLAASDIPLSLSSIIGLLVTISVFVLFYKFIGKAHYSPKKMPLTGLDDELFESIASALRPQNWGVKKVSTKSHSGALVWNDSYAFVITSLIIDQKFGISGNKRKQFLSYKGENINAWLTQLNSDLVPVLGVGGAEIMLILLDEKNVNGLEFKTIGVNIPDSHHRLAVGVAPVKQYYKDKKFVGMMNKIIEKYSPFLRELTPKQRMKLDKKLDNVEAFQNLNKDSEEEKEQSKTVEVKQD